MSSARLNEDLLKDFREQKAIIYNQIEICEPLANHMRQAPAKRLLDSIALVTTEALCYLLSASGVVMAIFLHKLYPFYILAELRAGKEYKHLGKTNLLYLMLSVYAIIAIAVICCYIIGRLMRRIRTKNEILGLANNKIKELIGQQLQRKAAIEAIEQRHFMDFAVPNRKPKVNEVQNPGY